MGGYTISEAGIANIRKTIDAATADPRSQIPGFVACIVNKDGQEIFSHAAGKRGVDTNEPMTTDSVFWIASCTKMISGIACMQLVEQGKLALDDADLLEKLCPELKAVKILKGFADNGSPVLVEKKNRITLRMLLTHTSGFGYAAFNSELRKASLPEGYDECSAAMRDIEQPLLFEPGTKWNYGVSIDWAGIALERATNMSLNDYIQQHICQPLGMKNVSMFPTASMKAQMAHMHERNATTGKISSREHVYRRPLIVQPGSAEQKSMLNSAGAGCFGQPSEYTKLIAMLLNNGKSPTSGVQILKSATVEEMFKNQIPDMPNFGRNPIADVNLNLTNPLTELYPQPNDPPQGFGITFMLTIAEGITGRGKNTVWWAGLPNLFWWCDREKGVGGIVASQILPFGDPQVMGLWFAIEAAVYQG